MDREHILARLRERIVAFAASHLSRDAAEDLAQEVLLVLHEKYPQLERIEDLLPLSLQIVRFKILSTRRKAARRGEYTQVSVTELPLPGHDPDPEELLERRETARTADPGDGKSGRTLPRIDAPQIAGEDLSGDSEDHGRGGHQHDLHLGPPVPQEPAGRDGWRMGGKAMTPEDVHKLLGGYATGTLTEAEKEALFAAALEDQEVFEALMKEEPLREVLQDPGARAEMLRALDGTAVQPRWWQWRPLIGAVAMAGVALGAVAVWRATREQPVAPVMVAEVAKQAPVPPRQQPAIIEPAAPLRAARKPAAETRPPADVAAAENRPAGKDQLAVGSGAPVSPQAKTQANDAAVPVETLAAGARQFKAQDAASPAAAPSAAPPLPPAGQQQALQQAGQLAAPSPMVQQNAAVQSAPLIDRAAAATATSGFRPSAVKETVAMEKKAMPLVQWTILRGDTEAPPETVLDRDEAIRLRIVSLAAVTLTLTDGETVLASAKVEPSRPFVTPPIPYTGPGPRTLRLTLASSPAQPLTLTLTLHYAR